MRRRSINPGVVCAPVATLLVLVLLAGPAQAASPTLRVTADTTLTADFAGEVVIAKDGVTFDCAGHRILGNGNGRGVLVDKRTGVTVRNCDVSNFTTGFLVVSTRDSTFENNSSHDNMLANPNQTPGWISGAGFWMQSSSSNTLVNNRIYDNPSDGLDVLNSPNNLFVGNNVDRNLAGWFIFGKHSTGNVVRANGGEGNDFAAFVLAEGASGNLLENNTATGNVDGFLVGESSGNILLDNTASSNTGSGIGLVSASSNNTLNGNTASGNADFGIVLLGDSNANVVSSNTANSNGFIGIAAGDGSSFNTFDQNTALNNGFRDAGQDETTTGNVWTNNTFGTTIGI